MNFISKLRREFAHWLYKAPEVKTDDGILNERGIFEYALDTRVKRDVIRELGHHMGVRKYYSEDRGSYGINYLGDYAVYDSEFPVSRDMTDYDSEKEYFETLQEAKRKHLVECIRECVESKVLEFATGDGEFVDDHTIDWENVTGVRPGPRFECAVQPLLFGDKTSDSMNYWKS